MLLFPVFLNSWLIILGVQKKQMSHMEKFPHGDPDSYNSLCVSFLAHLSSFIIFRFPKNTNLVRAFSCWNVFNGFSIALRLKKTKPLKWSERHLETSLGSSYTILHFIICVTLELPRAPFDSVLFPSWDFCMYCFLHLKILLRTHPSDLRSNDISLIKFSLPQVMSRFFVKCCLTLTSFLQNTWLNL